MNRVLFCLLIAALIVVRVMPLHGHLLADAHDHAAAGAAHHTHPLLHSHGMAEAGAANEHHHDAVEIDLLGSALAREAMKTNMLTALTAAIVLLFSVLWVCIAQRRIRTPLLIVSSPPQWRPSPRAPPR